MEIGSGCVNLGSASSTLSLAGQVRLVHAAIDAGVSVFDTADAYGSGSSEHVLGRALGSRRDGIVLSTKAGYVFRARTVAEQHSRRLVHRGMTAVRRFRPDTEGAGPMSGGSGAAYSQQDFSAAHLRDALERSLRRLRTDHVDVLQLHGPARFSPGLLAELDDLVRSGTVGRFGVGAETTASAIDWAVDERLRVVQLPFGVLDPETLDEVAPIAQDHDIDVWVRGVLAGGVLSAAMSDAESVRDHPKNDVIVGLLDVANRSGIELDELALRWIAGRSEPQVMLIGMSSVAHIRRNVELARRGPLSGDVIDEIDRVIRTVDSESPGP